MELKGDQVIIGLLKSLTEEDLKEIVLLKNEAELFLGKQGYMPHPESVIQNWLIGIGWEIIKPFKIADIDYSDDVVF